MAVTDKYRIVQVPDGAASNMTLYQVTGLTPARYEAMAKTEYNLARVIAESVEARAVGVTPKPLYELLMSRVSEVDKGLINTKKVPGQSVILPFSYRRRRTNVAADDFAISAGAANANAGTTTGGITYPTSSWDVVISAGPSWMQTSGLQNLERYFLKGEYVYVEFVKKTGTAGVDRDTRVTPFLVINSVNIDASTARLTLAANVTAAQWTAFSAAQKAVYQPDHGVIHGGTNSVKDEEAWAYNQASDLSASLLVDWHQTSRYTQVYNDKYEEMLNAYLNGDVNAFQGEFNWLPLAEQNKQQRMRYEKKWMNSIFYGDVISELQAAETYDQLPQVVDPDDGTIFGYKANALGLRTLLRNENQVVDLHGGTLDLTVVFDLSWKLKKNREANGEVCEVICFMTDKDTAKLIDLQMITAIKNYYGYGITQFFEPGQILGTDGQVRYKFKKYDIPGYDFQIAIFVEDYFTERLLHFGDGSGGAQGTVNFKSAGRALWAVDWSDFNIGLVGTNSVKREYKGKAFTEVNPLFATVITPNTKHYDLRSTTWTTQLGDAKRSLMIENFSTVAALAIS